MYALWWLATLRGEVAGLCWADLDLHHRQLVIVRARTTAGYQVFEGLPKSAANTRTLALDRHTVAVLREHARWQHQERHAADGRWQATGYVFTDRYGDPLHPGFLTHRFAALVTAAGLPPIRLHDLRHGAATEWLWVWLFWSDGAGGAGAIWAMAHASGGFGCDRRVGAVMWEGS
ncbi:MAG: tyrosine-type recombinase/integrase [Sciscionella sp.]